MNDTTAKLENLIGSNLFGFKLKNLSNLIASNDKSIFNSHLTEIINSLKNALGAEYIVNFPIKQGFTIACEDTDLAITSFFYKNENEWFEVVATFDLQTSKVYCSVETANNNDIFDLDDLKAEYLFTDFFSVMDNLNPTKFEILITSILLPFMPIDVIENNHVKEVLKFLVLFIRSEYDRSNNFNLKVKKQLLVNLACSNSDMEFKLSNFESLVQAPYMDIKW